MLLYCDKGLLLPGENVNGAMQGCNCDKGVLALAAAQNTPVEAVQTRESPLSPAAIRNSICSMRLA